MSEQETIAVSAAASASTAAPCKRAVVTGGNQGMGLVTAAALAASNYHVTISVRSDSKGQEAVRTLQQNNPDAVVDYVLMDNGDLSTVYSFASQLDAAKLDLLVCNAGIMNTPFALSKDGIEMQYQVNHLAHFLLTHLLMPRLQAASGTARVIYLSSRAHMRHPQPIDYAALKAETTSTDLNGWGAYGRSKLSNLLTAKALARRFPPATSGVAFFSLHPGLVETNLLAIGGGSLAGRGMNVEDGIRCTIWLATSTELEGMSGNYFHNEVTYYIDPEEQARHDLMSQIATDPHEAENCWTNSLAMLGLAEDGFGTPLPVP